MFKTLEDMSDFDSILTWGLAPKAVLDLLKKHPACTVTYMSGSGPGSDYLFVNGIRIYNFVGDCGTLCLFGANNISRESLAFIEDFASHSGFSNIFATICKADTTKPVAIFKERGWEEIHKANSNRNLKREHHIMFLHIDCVHKGY